MIESTDNESKDIKFTNFESDITDEQYDKVISISNIFVPTPRLKALSDDIKYVRNMAKMTNYTKEPNCILVTGETGVGKTTFIEEYKKKYPPVEEECRTKISVLVSEVVQANHPRPFLFQLLIDLGEELEGIKGTSTELTNRLVDLLIGTGAEVIFIDEFHEAIETKSKTVIYSIANKIKTLVNRSKIPIVLFGVPWSAHVLTVNSQLKKRFQLRHELINYTVKDFIEFQMFLQKLEEKLPIESEKVLWEKEMAFRLFSASQGSVDQLMKIIRPAAIQSICDGTEILTNENLAHAVKRFIQIPDKLNPLLINIKDVVAKHQINNSKWNYNAKRGDNPVIEASYKSVDIQDIKDELEIKDVC